MYIWRFYPQIEEAVFVNEGVKVVIRGPKTREVHFNEYVAKDDVSIVSEIQEQQGSSQKSVKVKVRLWFYDTAGLSDNQEGIIEKIGIDLAKKALNQLI